MVTSASNPVIVNTKKLLQKKYRYQFGQYIIEGIKLVREAIKRNQSICYFVLNVSSADKFVDELNGFECFVVEDKVFDTLCDTVTNQGILGVLNLPDTALVVPTSKCLILQNVQDPSNVGAILRTAVATGYNFVYLIDSADPFGTKCIRSGMSAQFFLKICMGDLSDVLSIVKQTCVVCCADMDGQNVFQANVPTKHALLLGNEGNGVSQQAKSACDLTVSLPMQNELESLNVSVSAGILMYFLSNKN